MISCVRDIIRHTLVGLAGWVVIGSLLAAVFGIFTLVFRALGADV